MLFGKTESKMQGMDDYAIGWLSKISCFVCMDSFDLSKKGPVFLLYAIFFGWIKVDLYLKEKIENYA